MNNFAPLGLITLAVSIRWLVAQFPYSGHDKPPMYGDYEAQRHWMEVTTHLPVKDWYQNTTDNDLLYWGLDYPPLTAYHMYVLGTISNKLNTSWLELHTSRGHESYHHKIFMRSTVIFADFLIYIPAIIYYFYRSHPIQYTSPPSNDHKQNVAVYTSFVLFYPAQILIDHGHFQYNGVFMGLVLWAIIFMTKGKQTTSALLFTLALNYKQMSLYYSLPFFWYIASVNLRLKPHWKGLRNIFMIGFIVIMTFVVMFVPFIQSQDCILQVIRRIFPFSRGVFEDKVANFWFSLSIIYKFRKIHQLEELVKFSALLTLVASMPAGLHLLFRPSIRSFMYALVNISLVFFLFSFQVHEKTILVPALPILLLFREHPMVVNWFVIVSTFSLQPLLYKDGLAVPYIVLMCIYTLMSIDIFGSHLKLTHHSIFTISNLNIVAYLTSILGCFILNASASLIKPPTRYPDIHPTINALYSWLHFTCFLIFFYRKQFEQETKRIATDQRILLIKKTK